MAPLTPPRYNGPVKKQKSVARKRPAARKATKVTTRPPAAQKSGERQCYEGGCHCGAIAYSYATAMPPRRWPVCLCQCGFCRGHGVRATSDPDGELKFRFERPEFLRRYRFALRTADYLICKECGSFVGAVLLSGRGAQGFINLNTLLSPPAGIPSGKPVAHDLEPSEVRRSRRMQTWTPVIGPV